MKLLQHCRNLVADPAYRNTCLAEIKDRTRGIVGYFSNYIPPEVIAAAGFHPLRIIGTLTPAAGASPRGLFNPVCSFVQDVWAAARSGAFAQLDRIVFPNSCDALKLLGQQWEDAITHPPAETLLHPIQADAASIPYFAEVLRQWASRLKVTGGIDFTDTDLRVEIDQANAVRWLQRRLYAIRKLNPAVLAGSDVITLITAGFIMDRRAYRRQLEQVVQEAAAQDPSARPDGKNLMLIGPLVDNLELLRQIERQGVCLIDDDITNGSRSIDRDVEMEGDPYINLAERCLRAAPSPTLYTDTASESAAFTRRIADLQPDGVLFIIQKYCEPHVHNYLSKAEALRRMGIPALMLEVEHGQDSLAPADLLRVESLIEVA
jgi:benzoyl-CoA reductase/2-hydroxyglutaryl-CoA dehydratase subunit BcrC/BadD/HgdB